MRSLVLLSVVGLIATSLTGCTTGSDSCPVIAVNGGKAVDSITVTSNSAGVPEAKFATPLQVSKAEVRVLSPAEGQKVLPGGAYSLDVALFNGESGESLGSTSFNGTDVESAVISKSDKFAFLNSLTQCATVGSRIVGIVPNNQIVDSSGNPLTGGSTIMTLVVVAEIKSASLPRANGELQQMPEGLPKVVLDPKGTPGITIPTTAAPTELKIALLNKGNGPSVSESSNVIVHYTGVLWDGGSVFDSSWKRGEVATFNIGQVVPGFSQALIGQTVGSQILAVIPPDLAYGAAGAGSTIPPNSTLVFVIDLLGIEGP